MFKKYRALFVFICAAKLAFAQQEPQYTQYMYNLSVINPAYTINEVGTFQLGALYRTQWMKADGAPKTYSGFFHGVINNRIEAGINVVSNSVGNDALQELHFSADVAYILPLKEKLNLAFGIKSGVTNFKVDLDGFVLPETQIDEAFPSSSNTWNLQLGTGVFLSHPDFYAGLSVPNLIPSKNLLDENGIAKHNFDQTHIYLNGGYVFAWELLKLKPSTMVKWVTGLPLSVDVSLNLMYKDRLEFGIFYRNSDAVGGMFHLVVSQGLSLGYAYDYIVSDLNNFSTGSHEMFVRFQLKSKKEDEGNNKSPRFY